MYDAHNTIVKRTAFLSTVECIKNILYHPESILFSKYLDSVVVSNNELTGSKYPNFRYLSKTYSHTTAPTYSYNVVEPLHINLVKEFDRELKLNEEVKKDINFIVQIWVGLVSRYNHLLLAVFPVAESKWCFIHFDSACFFYRIVIRLLLFSQVCSMILILRI